MRSTCASLSRLLAASCPTLSRAFVPHRREMKIASRSGVVEKVLSFELEAAQDAQGGGQDEEQEAARRTWLTQRDLASVDSFSGTFSSRRTSEILGRYHGRARPSSVV